MIDIRTDVRVLEKMSLLRVRLDSEGTYVEI